MIKEFFFRIHYLLKLIFFIDCPSGDMTWMPLFLRSRTDVIYSGRVGSMIITKMIMTWKQNSCIYKKTYNILNENIINKCNKKIL